MGLFDFLNDEKREQQLCKLRDFLALAYADKEFSKEEENFIIKIFLGIEKVNKNDFLSMAVDATEPNSVKDAYPKTTQGKIEYLSQMVALMMVDGECSRREIQYCNVMAIKMGFDSKAVSSLVALFLSQMDDEQKKINLFLSYATNGGEIE
jgi:hypothetical protein